MTGSLSKGYRSGTHRVVSPQETLSRVTPVLPDMGITRLANITGLDRLGIPTFCAMRPASRIIQVSNGKGLEEADARVSALMEAIEIYHAEQPELTSTYESMAELRAAGWRVVSPDELPDNRTGLNFNESRRIHWVEAEELHSQETWLIPASAAYPMSPSLFVWWTNGLASGNHLLEATLHGIYEVMERHALAVAAQPAAGIQGFVSPPVNYCNLGSIESDPVLELWRRILQAGLELRLATARTPGPLHTFWAILLDPDPLAITTLVNTGYGTHLSPTVAAVRAITEAAQSRLSFIHASREDLAGKAAFTDHNRLRQAYDHFQRVLGMHPWPSTDHSGATFDEDYSLVLSQLYEAGFQRIFRVNLTRKVFEIPVVKIIIPGARVDLTMV